MCPLIFFHLHSESFKDRKFFRVNLWRNLGEFLLFKWSTRNSLVVLDLGKSRSKLVIQLLIYIHQAEHGKLIVQLCLCLSLCIYNSARNSAWIDPWAAPNGELNTLFSSSHLDLQMEILRTHNSFQSTFYAACISLHILPCKCHF